MEFLDIRTVLVVSAISSLVCTFVLISLWRQNHDHYSGMELWWGNYGLLFVGMVLIALRGLIPNVLSITIGNALIIFGNLIFLIGLERFLDKTKSQIHNYVIYILFLLIHGYFTYIAPSLLVRNIVVSLILTVYVSQIAWLMLVRTGTDLRRITREIGMIAIIFCIVAIIRIVVDLQIPLGNDILKSSIYETLIYLTFLIINIVMAFHLTLLVNRRLFLELESDIHIRSEVEAALRLSEEKFSKAFQSGPDAVLITRLRDGHYIDVNEGFTHLSGYSKEEALSGSALKFGVWGHPEDRDRALAELRATSRLRDFETDMRLKSGILIKVMLSGELLTLDNEECAIWVVRDITENKHVESILHLRLMLWEFSTSHTATELMQKALDEIETLTGSQIGFYHFVHENSSTLTLQAWSTRTSEEFCKAAVGGTHSPIADAGVWADCVRERKPVIHNDYPSLPTRKGLPEGHAAVIREIMVPTLRNNQVVSVLGVGNKPVDYTEKDVEVVSYIGDMVWDIVSQKEANEKIRQLNIQLENLAMVDELTGLTNRRAFFIKAGEEINKTKRYRPPLSAIMLDIDRFKSINDTYGHEAGDMALQCIAKTLLSNIRVVDVAARLGGEEFAILLPSTTAKKAMVLAERLRVAIAENHCILSDNKVSVTASLGVAEFSEGMQDLDDLLRNADSAMYQAKNQGRNRVVMFGGENSEQDN
jgi:diguanylate cyclase (GGDEF)-like protein/PAS domain S-box-containing protein